MKRFQSQRRLWIGMLAGLMLVLTGIAGCLSLREAPGRAETPRLLADGSGATGNANGDGNLAPAGFAKPAKPPAVLEKKWLRGGPKRRADLPDQAAKHFALKRVPKGQVGIPVERYAAAIAHARRMPQQSTARKTLWPSRAEMNLSPEAAEALLGGWTPLGPGNIGGRTRGLLVDPLTPATMYAAGVAGGVWKTTNSGASWTPLMDSAANLAVASLAMDPSNTSVIYAGTGEGVFNGDAVRGAGIFRTTNAGATWQQLASTNTADFHYVNKMVVSPNDGQRLYAATRTGVWRSLNGGSTWSRVLDPGAVNGCLDLVVRTDQATDYLFATCGTFVQATVYRNVQAEGSGVWTAVLTEAGMGRTTLAIAPSNQSIIYALASSVAAGTFQYGLHAVFRSTSSGNPGTWTAQVRNTNPTKLNTVLLTNPVFAFYQECFGPASQYYNQGWYDNVIAVDPADANRVWAGGIDLFRSDDGGANWGMAGHWWAGSTSPRYVHADNHVLVFHPQYNGTTNRTLFVGNDGGLFRTTDARAAVATGPTAPCNTSNGSVPWTSLNNGYGVTQFYHGLPYPGGTTYFGGTQDNGTLRGLDSTGANSWTAILGGDGGYVAVDPANTNILYGEFTGLSIQKSTNGGGTFAAATSGITGDNGFQFIAPFAMDPGNASRLWTGGWYLWRTTNAATTWSRASAVTPGNGAVSAFAIHPTDGNRVLAAMSDGYILRTSTGLSNTSTTVWPNVRPRTGYVSSLTFDPTDANIAYVTYSTFGGTHVWRSIDGGATWTGIDGTGLTGIPDVPVHTVVVSPSNTARLYIGTDIGVFSSTDSGATWATENTGFANAITEGLAVGTVSGEAHLFAFTHGRGAWRVSLERPTVTITATDGSAAEAPLGTGTLTVSRTGSTTAPLNVLYSVGGSATVGSDYTTLTGGVTIPAGQSTATITVTPINDNLVEGAETVVVTLSPTAAYTVGVPVSATVTITSDDATALSITDASVAEGNTGTKNFVFTVRLSNPSASAVTVRYATANGTATAGSDYTAVPATTLTFAPRQMSQPVAVVVTGDLLVEPNETFFVNLSAPSGATIADGQGLGTIFNDEGRLLRITDVVKGEGNSGVTPFAFTVTLSAVSTSPVTVTYATANGSAVAPGDYAASVPTVLTFAPGQTSRVITVNVVGEAAAEANETFVVNLSTAVGATIFDLDLRGVGTILNDEGPVLRITDVSKAEGNAGTSAFTFTVTLAPASASTVTVNYATANSSAAAGSDYTTTSGTLTFSPGQTSKPVPVTVTGDTALEANEVFVVNLSSAVGATIIDPDFRGIGTILNDDGPTLSISNVTATEGHVGNKNFVFMVTLSAVAASNVTVNCVTANGTAVSPGDYTAGTTALTFTPGQASKPCTVPVIGNTVVEPNETFFVNLTTAVGATLFKPQGVGTITNDD